MSKMPPSMVVLLHATFVDAFARVARELGASDDDIAGWIAQVPDAVAGENAWYDRVSNVWRYCFGDVSMIGGVPTYGPHTWPQMEWAVRAARVMHCHMTTEDRSRFHRQAFGLAMKHADALAECRPLFRLCSGATAAYEVDGAGRKRVDWTITTPEGTRVLLEVKRRPKPVYEFFGTLLPRRAQDTPPFAFDTDTLFKDTESKFPATTQGGPLHGLWIEKVLQLDDQDILKSFSRLDPARVHFAVLAGTEQDVTLFCYDSATARVVENLFGVRVAQVYRA